MKEFHDMTAVELPGLNMNAPGGILDPSQYVERWRISLWDKAFLPFLASKTNVNFSKSSVLKEFEGGENAWRRVLYR